MGIRYYVNAAPQLQIASLTSGAASLSLASGTFTGWPSSFPFFAAIDYGTASVEIVSVTSIVGTTANIVRGQDGTTGISHLAGATLDFVFVAQDAREANTHINNTTGVHGVSGSVVGTSDVQTLTNKTLTSPTITTPNISSPAVTGTATGVNEHLTGTFQADGTSTLAAVNASGAIHTTAAGTALTVDHDASVGGALTVSGAIHASNLIGVLEAYTYANAAARDAAITSPVAGMIVFLLSPGLLSKYDGTAWHFELPPEAHDYLQLIVGGTPLHTPTSGTATWVDFGNKTVPAWATKAIISLAVTSSNPSSGSALNVNAHMKVGTATGVNLRIPGSTNTTQQSWGWTDEITLAGTGAQDFAIEATFNAGTGTFDLASGSVISGRITYLP